VTWLDVDEADERYAGLYASHKQWVDQVAATLKSAREWTAVAATALAAAVAALALAAAAIPADTAAKLPWQELLSYNAQNTNLGKWNQCQDRWRCNYLGRAGRLPDVHVLATAIAAAVAAAIAAAAIAAAAIPTGPPHAIDQASGWAFLMVARTNGPTPRSYRWSRQNQPARGVVGARPRPFTRPLGTAHRWRWCRPVAAAAVATAVDCVLWESFHCVSGK
jgi:hypothetical protein